MNREQAEHILDAYLLTCRKIDDDGIYPDSESEKARDALREVILDVMTEYKSKPITLPGITLPSTNYPRDWDYALKPQTTCPDYTPKVTYTIDPAFNTNTVSTVDGTAMAVGYQDGVVKVVDR